LATIQLEKKTIRAEENISTRNLNLLSISLVSFATRNGRKFIEREHQTNDRSSNLPGRAVGSGALPNRIHPWLGAQISAKRQLRNRLVV